MIKQIDLIACIDSNYRIGNNGQLLFNIREDMQRFKDITTSKGSKDREGVADMVIMGRKTWDSLPEKSKPLKGRVNVIITSSVDDVTTWSFKDYGTIAVPSLQKALDLYNECPEEYNVHIIGGGQIYAQAIEQGIPELLYITHVDSKGYGDTLFPSNFLDKYVEIADEGKRDNGTYSYTFKTYARKV